MSDAYAPHEIARRVRELGVAKARSGRLSLFVLAVLAGAFISLGAMFFTVVVTQPTLGFGVTRMIGGVAFSTGLILVLVGGAELFTGNNLVAMAWASRQISFRELMRNWGLVYAGNVVGVIGTAGLVAFSGVHRLSEVEGTAISIAAAKCALDPLSAIAAGVLCNALVCLAVWLSMGGRSVADKVLGIVFPITAFVACGLEHSIANWFFFAWAGMLGAGSSEGFFVDAATNLTMVTIGNILGGTLLVAGVYWLAYLRNEVEH